MASSYKTPNLELSKYVEDDKPTMWDYNEDMERLDGLAGGVDTLAADLRGHLHHKSNPHEVTARQVDTYTRAEMDAFLLNKANKGPLNEIALVLRDDFEIAPQFSYTAGYYTKTQEDIVYISGYIQRKDKAAFGHNVLLLQLPVGFRPSKTVITPCLFSDQYGGRYQPSYCQVYINGALNVAHCYGSFWATTDYKVAMINISYSITQ